MDDPNFSGTVITRLLVPIPFSLGSASLTGCVSRGQYNGERINQLHVSIS